MKILDAEKGAAKVQRWLGLKTGQANRAILLFGVTVCALLLAGIQLEKECFDSDLGLAWQDTALLLGAFGGILLCGIFAIAAEYRKSEARWQAIVFMQIFLLGLLIRFLLIVPPFANQNADITTYLLPWCQALREMPFRQAIAADVGNYTMPYRFFLAVVAHTHFTELYCIKLLSVLFDCGVVLAIWLLTRMLGCSYRQQLAAFCVILFAPTFFMNSAYWGQCDAIYSFFCLLSLYYGIRRNSPICWILAGIGLGMKMQAIFLLPILIVLCMAGRLRLRWCPLYPAAILLMNLPSMLAGCSLTQIANIYFGQTGEATVQLSWNATTLWTFFPISLDETIGKVALAVSGALLALLFYVFVDRIRSMGKEQLVLFAGLLMLFVIYCLPGMHERYFYMAEALMAVYMVCRPRNAWAAATLYLADFTRYASFLFGDRNSLETSTGFFSAEFQALLVGGSLIWMMWSFYQEVREAGAEQLAADIS